MSHINFNFLSNNVKGMQSSKKCLKPFEYFKSKLKPSELLSYKKHIRPLIAKKKRKDEFGGDLHFFHGSSNSCGVLMVFHGNQNKRVKKSCPIKKDESLF